MSSWALIMALRIGGNCYRGGGVAGCSGREGIGWAFAARGGLFSGFFVLFFSISSSINRTRPSTFPTG
jgi:hypothetical protein